MMIQETRKAQELLASAGITGVVAVPVDQLLEMYSRFRALTKMGTATVEEWLAMPPDIADLRHAIFAQSDFGAVFAGQWLPKEVRDRERDRRPTAPAAATGS